MTSHLRSQPPSRRKQEVEVERKGQSVRHGHRVHPTPASCQDVIFSPLPWKTFSLSSLPAEAREEFPLRFDLSAPIFYASYHQAKQGFHSCQPSRCARQRFRSRYNRRTRNERTAVQSRQRPQTRIRRRPDAAHPSSAETGWIHQSVAHASRRHQHRYPRGESSCRSSRQNFPCRSSRR